MDMEEFCDRYCPIPTRYINNTNKIDPTDVFADCHLEESDCPFNKVDFTKVVANPSYKPIIGYISEIDDQLK